MQQHLTEVPFAASGYHRHGVGPEITASQITSAPVGLGLRRFCGWQDKTARNVALRRESCWMQTIGVGFIQANEK